MKIPMAEANNKEQPIIVKKIIKKAGGHGHHGGAWKVAYADFVTAMMALFMLLWIVNMDPSAKSAIADFFKEPVQTGPMQGTNAVLGGSTKPGEPGPMDGGASFFKFRQLKITQQNQEEVAKEMKKEIERRLGQSEFKALLKSVEIKATDRGILVEIHEEKGKPLFKSGSTTFTEETKALIASIAEIIKGSNNKMIVSGFTDAARYGNGSYDNWNLSVDRAQTLRKHLISRGVERERLARVEGYADTQLKAPETPYASINRRLTILLLNDVGLQNLIPDEPTAEERLAAQETASVAKQKYYGRLRGQTAEEEAAAEETPAEEAAVH